MPVKKKKQFFTSCVNSTADAINEMTEKAREISYETFMSHVDRDEVKNIFPNYDWSVGPKRKYGLYPFRLKNDYAVSFHRSKYKGMPCVYIRHSSIEYIFG